MIDRSLYLAPMHLLCQQRNVEFLVHPREFFQRGSKTHSTFQRGNRFPKKNHKHLMNKRTKPSGFGIACPGLNGKSQRLQEGRSRARPVVMASLLLHWTLLRLPPWRGLGSSPSALWPPRTQFTSGAFPFSPTSCWNQPDSGLLGSCRTYLW